MSITPAIFILHYVAMITFVAIRNIMIHWSVNMAAIPQHYTVWLLKMVNYLLTYLRYIMVDIVCHLSHIALQINS